MRFSPINIRGYAPLKLIRLMVSVIYERNNDYRVVPDLKEVITKIDWKNVIILDACRYDAFKLVIEKTRILSSINVKPIISNTSSTPEFLREIILNNRDLFRDVIYISANPMVDVTLKGSNAIDIFYKYIPVWKFAWNERYNTVLPKDLYMYALKMFIKYPSKKIIIHFLQPHFPYISDQYDHINKLVHHDIIQTKKWAFLDEESKKDNLEILLLVRLLKLFLSHGIICSVLSPDYCEYVKRNSNKILEAYISNLIKVLPYVKDLIATLPGKTIVTADHGEALGEFMHPYIPIRLWGHISRIRIPSLNIVPLVLANNKISVYEGVRRALKKYVRLMLKARWARLNE